MEAQKTLRRSVGGRCREIGWEIGATHPPPTPPRRGTPDNIRPCSLRRDATLGLRRRARRQARQDFRGLTNDLQEAQCGTGRFSSATFPTDRCVAGHIEPASEDTLAGVEVTTQTRDLFRSNVLHLWRQRQIARLECDFPACMFERLDQSR